MWNEEDILLSINIITVGAKVPLPGSVVPQQFQWQRSNKPHDTSRQTIKKCDVDVPDENIIRVGTKLFRWQKVFVLDKFHWQRGSKPHDPLARASRSATLMCHMKTTVGAKRFRCQEVLFWTRFTGKEAANFMTLPARASRSATLTS